MGVCLCDLCSPIGHLLVMTKDNRYCIFRSFGLLLSHTQHNFWIHEGCHITSHLTIKLSKNWEIIRLHLQHTCFFNWDNIYGNTLKKDTRYYLHRDCSPSWDVFSWRTFLFLSIYQGVLPTPRLNRRVGLLLTPVPRAKTWVPRFADPITVKCQCNFNGLTGNWAT